MAFAGVALLLVLLRFEQAQAAAFLSEQLPLKPVITTPMEVLKGEASETVFISGRQSITVRTDRSIMGVLQVTLGSNTREHLNSNEFPAPITARSQPILYSETPFRVG